MGMAPEALAERWRADVVKALTDAAGELPVQGPVRPPGLAPRVAKYVLANGMVLLLLPIPGSDHVAVRVALGTGSVHDGNRAGYGLAWSVAQAVPLGTRHWAGEELRAEIRRLGGAFTLEVGQESTHFQIVSTPDRAHDAIRFVADLVRHATFPPSALAAALSSTGAGATADGPAEALERELRRGMFRRHPARYSTDGTPALRALLRRDDLLAHYNRCYVPENAVCAVVGDIDPTNTLARLTQAFSGWAYRPAPANVLPVEPPATGMRRRLVYTGRWVGAAIGWRTVPLWDPATSALRVVAALLGEGKTARLRRAAEEAGIAATALRVRCRSSCADVGYLAVLWTAAAPEEHEAIETLVRSQVRRLRLELVTPGELSDTVSVLRDAAMQRRSQPAPMAERLAHDELATGDPAHRWGVDQRLDALTADQLRSVAQRYLRPENSTVVLLRSGSPSPVAAAESSPGGPP
jgi:zinc protease